MNLFMKTDRLLFCKCLPPLSHVITSEQTTTIQVTVNKTSGTISWPIGILCDQFIFHCNRTTVEMVNALCFLKCANTNSNKNLSNVMTANRFSPASYFTSEWKIQPFTRWLAGQQTPAVCISYKLLHSIKCCKILIWGRNDFDIIDSYVIIIFNRNQVTV